MRHAICRKPLQPGTKAVKQQQATEEFRQMRHHRLQHMLSRNYIIFVLLLCSCAAFLCYTLLSSRESVDKRDDLVTKTHRSFLLSDQ